MKHIIISFLALNLFACDGTDSIEHTPDADSCSPESDTEFCSRLALTCGPAQNTDNCGTQRSVTCGVCDFDTRCRTACNVPGGAQNCTSVDFNSCVNQCNLQTKSVSETCGDCIVERTTMNEVLGICTITNGADDTACDSVCTPSTTNDYFTATVGATTMCALGWTTLVASADGSELSIIGKCTGSNMGIWFKPTPAPGSSSPCDRLQSNMTNFCTAQSEQYPVAGTITVSGTEGNFRIDGSCSCPNDNAVVEFSLPLIVN